MTLNSTVIRTVMMPLEPVIDAMSTAIAQIYETVIYPTFPRSYIRKPLSLSESSGMAGVYQHYVLLEFAKLYGVRQPDSGFYAGPGVINLDIVDEELFAAFLLGC
jgi:hypothetical protein